MLRTPAFYLLLIAASAHAIPLDQGTVCEHEDDVFPHPESCGLFYQCLKGIPHEKKCPNDLHFNPSLLACDYPEHAGCTVEEHKEVGIKCNERNGLQQHPNTCSLYIHCVDGVPLERECPAGLVFNSRIDSCDMPENTKCPGDDKDEGDSELSHFCPEGQTLLRPNPNDCHSYIQCVNGVAFKRDCPDGLAFNTKIQNCDYKENVKCNAEDPEPPKCPAANGLHATFLKHETSCSSYYICNHGQPILQHCSANLHFNPSLNVCDFPANARCNTGKSTGEDPFLKLKCPRENGNKPIFHKHPLECHLFFVCDHGRLQLQRCPASLRFNEKFDVCDHPDNVKC